MAALTYFFTLAGFIAFYFMGLNQVLGSVF